MCGAGPGKAVSKTGSYVEILFDGSRENFDPMKASKECECTIERSQVWVQRLDVMVFDLRMYSYQVNYNI